MCPKISVIIPAYNTEAYIVQAIESVLGQTEKNIEVIVVDDASTDNTAEIARSFADKRLKVLVNQENRQQSYTFNRGLREAKGKWLALLDSDDWYAPDRLEKLLQLAESEDADMIADDVYFIQNGEKLPWSTLLSQSRVSIDKITHIESIFFVENDLPGIWSVPLGLTKPIFKRNFLIQHGIERQEDIYVGEDFWMYLTCLAYGANFVLVPQAYYFYRSRPDSIMTMKQEKRLEQYCKVNQGLLEQDYIKKNPQLLIALQNRLKLLEKTRPYLHVVDRIKEKKLMAALTAMIHNPYFLYHLMMQLPRILLRRLHYYFLRININY